MPPAYILVVVVVIGFFGTLIVFRKTHAGRALLFANGGRTCRREALLRYACRDIRFNSCLPGRTEE